MTSLFPASPSRRRTYAALATGVIALAIAYLSLVGAGSVPAPTVSDKVKHAGAYAALAAPMTYWLGLRRVVWVLAISIVFGAAMEVAQGLMDNGRVASLSDGLANAVGAGIGAALAFVWTGAEKKRRRGLPQRRKE